jgi:predicted N-acetyltransferase YhbS
MPIISNSAAREKLKTLSAKEAFDRLTALGAHWVVIEDKLGHVYIAPSIETKQIGGRVLQSLISAASKKSTLVVVNAGDRAHRAEFTYDKKNKKFVPCKPAR